MIINNEENASKPQLEHRHDVKPLLSVDNEANQSDYDEYDNDNDEDSCKLEKKNVNTPPLSTSDEPMINNDSNVEEIADDELGNVVEEVNAQASSVAVKEEEEGEVEVEEESESSIQKHKLINSNFVYVNKKELKKLHTALSQIQEQQSQQQKLIEQIQIQLDTCVKAQIKSKLLSSSEVIASSNHQVKTKLNEISNTKNELPVVLNMHNNNNGLNGR